MQPGAEQERAPAEQAAEQAAVLETAKKNLEDFSRVLAEAESNLTEKLAKIAREGAALSAEDQAAIDASKRSLADMAAKREAMAKEFRELEAVEAIDISVEAPAPDAAAETEVAAADILEEEPDFDIDVVTPEERQAATEAAAEMRNAAPEQRVEMSRGIANLGFILNEKKAKVLSETLAWAGGKAEKGGFMNRVLEAASESYGRDAALARKRMENTGKLRHAGNIGAVISWGRVAWDVLGKNAAVLNPFRHVSAASLALGRGAEVAKEARLKNVEAKEKTRIADVDEANEIGWKLYAEAKANAGGDGTVNKASLDAAYGAGLPEDLRRRLEKAKELKTGNFLDKALRFDIATGVALIERRLKKIETNAKLDDRAKVLERAKLLARNEQFLKDTDRVLGDAGTVDLIGYGSRLTEKGAKYMTTAMILETLPQLYYRLHESFEENFGDLFTKADAAAVLKVAEKKGELDPETVMSSLPKETAEDLMSKMPEGSRQAYVEFAETIKAGEGYSQFMERQLKAHPGDFGFNPEKDGAVETWAKKIATKMVKDGGLYAENFDTRLEAGAAVKAIYDPVTKQYGVQLLSGEEYDQMRNMPPPPQGVLDLKSSQEFAPGVSGKFGYDEAGQVASFESSSSKEIIQRPQDLLLSDEGLLKASKLSLEDRKLLDADLADMYRNQEVLEALAKDGRGASDEAKMLRSILSSANEAVKSRLGGDALSTEHYERLQIAEAGSVTMRTIEIGGGLKGSFAYGPGGQVSGFKPAMISKVEAIKSLIAPEYRDDFIGSNNKSLLLTRIWEEQKALDKLTAQGRGGSAEARWLAMELGGYKKYLLQVAGGRETPMFTEKGFDVVFGTDAEGMKKAVERAAKHADAVIADTERQLKGLQPPVTPDAAKNIGLRSEEASAAAPAEAAKTIKKEVLRAPEKYDVVNPFVEDEKLLDFQGGKASFGYDKSGNVTEVRVYGTLTLEDRGKVDALLNDNWSETALKTGAVRDPELMRSVIEAEARSLYLNKKALAALEAAGQGGTPEAKYLAGVVKRNIDAAEKEYGDIYKE